MIIIFILYLARIYNVELHGYQKKESPTNSATNDIGKK